MMITIIEQVLSFAQPCAKSSTEIMPFGPDNCHIFILPLIKETHKSQGHATPARGRTGLPTPMLGCLQPARPTRMRSAGAGGPENTEPVRFHGLTPQTEQGLSGFPRIQTIARNACPEPSSPAPSGRVVQNRGRFHVAEGGAHAFDQLGIRHNFQKSSIVPDREIAPQPAIPEVWPFSSSRESSSHRSLRALKKWPVSHPHPSASS